MTHLTGSTPDDVTNPATPSEFHITLSAVNGGAAANSGLAETQSVFLADGRQIDVAALLQGGFTTTLISTDGNLSVGGFLNASGVPLETEVTHFKFSFSFFPFTL